MITLRYCWISAHIPLFIVVYNSNKTNLRNILEDQTRRRPSKHAEKTKTKIVYTLQGLKQEPKLVISCIRDDYAV